MSVYTAILHNLRHGRSLGLMEPTTGKPRAAHLADFLRSLGTVLRRGDDLEAHNVCLALDEAANLCDVNAAQWTVAAGVARDAAPGLTVTPWTVPGGRWVPSAAFVRFNSIDLARLDDGAGLNPWTVSVGGIVVAEGRVKGGRASARVEATRAARLFFSGAAAKLGALDTAKETCS